MDARLTEAQRLGLQWGREDGAAVSRADFVTEVRSWLATPFLHQHERKGHGVDCGGIVRGASVALGLIPPDYRRLIPPEVRGYARTPDGEFGRRLCDHYWTRIDIKSVRPADVLLIKYSKFPHHVAVVADCPGGGLSMIHALGPFHPAKVVEHRIDKTWMGRVVAAYSLPGVA